MSSHQNTFDQKKIRILVEVQPGFYSLMTTPACELLVTHTCQTHTMFPLPISQYLLMLLDHTNYSPFSFLTLCQPKPPFSTPSTILPHSNSEHKHCLNSRHGTDPTVCLGTYGEPIEVNVLTVTQPLRKGRSTILMYMFELARRHKCGYSAGCYELSKLPMARQPIETCCK